MLGFISKKKYKKVVKNLQKQLELENLRTAYWKMKFFQPEKEPIILGSQEDIAYIKK